MRFLEITSTSDATNRAEVVSGPAHFFQSPPIVWLGQLRVADDLPISLSRAERQREMIRFTAFSGTQCHPSCMIPPQNLRHWKSLVIPTAIKA